MNVAAVAWGQPLAFALLPLAPLLAWLALRREPSGAAPGPTLLHPDLHGLLGARRGTRPAAWRRLLPALALACWIVALAQPQRPGAPTLPPAQGRDVVVLLDTTLSMTLHDLRWDGRPAERLAVVKQVFTHFVDDPASAGDRFGIIAYGAAAATLLPPTFDRALARAMLARAQANRVGDGGALGDAIGLALRQVRPRQRLRPVLVVYSDNGWTQTGHISPAQAVALARELGVRVFTVQVGDTPADGSSYTVPAFPGPQPDMRAIAQATGGAYFYAADGGAQRAAIAAIARLAPTLQPPPRPGDPEPLYRWPLLAGLALLLGARFGGTPRRREPLP